MGNEINLSKEQINSLLGSLSGGTRDSETLKKSLTPGQQEQLQKVMSDPEKIKAVLTSPEAKKLLEMLRKKRE
ncbi:MAG: hypothetical protein IKB94_00020 [Clostridia bacterium]|nr:hypothetical protein [Clostridia bacterium]MBR2892214.1 hypothetical protein [Clostridia bacterium]